MRLFIINGPNLNMLGIREPEIYGRKTYADLVSCIESICLREGIMAECFQSNHEGEIVDIIQRAYGQADGIVINPAAYTHTSVAILDAIKAVGLPAVEVHLSDVDSREPFRRVSYVSEACFERVSGLGFEGYERAIMLMKERLQGRVLNISDMDH